MKKAVIILVLAFAVILAGCDMPGDDMPEPIWSISLDAPATHVFPALAQGYSVWDRQALTVTITNNGNQPAGMLTVELSGTNAASFSLNRTTIPSLPVGGTVTFTVTPDTGLPMGTYSATVTISGENITLQGFGISLEVTRQRTVEPVWLPEELRGSRPYGGTWTSRTQFENIYHTNFTDPRELVNELIGVVFPGYVGTEISVGNNFGAMLSFFQSQGWNEDNRQTRISMARSYALVFYSYFLQLRNYLGQRGNIVYSLVTYDNSFDVNVYRPYSTVTQVSSHLWIYEMRNNTVAISASATANHGSGSANQRTYMDVFLTIREETLTGFKSGRIYVFTYDDGEIVEYDFRTITSL